MSETRMLPKNTPRSTGIERTALAGPRPNPIGSNATSHVSAAPGVSAKTHAHVVSARDPAAAARRAQPQQPQPAGRDVKVEIVDLRRGQGQAGQSGPLGAVRSVQLIDRPRAIQAGGGSPFSPNQAALIGSLLEQYQERASAVGDGEQAALAGGALGALQSLLRAPQVLPTAPPASPAPSSAPTPGIAIPGVDGAMPIAADTSTVLVDLAAMRRETGGGDGPKVA